MKALGVVNQKGGAGKTNVSVNLSAEMAARGHRTLLINMDPQQTCRDFLTDQPMPGDLADVLRKRTKIHDAILRVDRWGTSLLSGSLDGMEDLEVTLARDASRVFCLAEVIGEIEDDFDRVIIDCRPSLAGLTQAAMNASTHIIIPVDGTEGLDGLVELEALLKRLAKTCDAELLGTVVTKFKARTKHFQEVREAIEDLRPFNTAIRGLIVTQELHAKRLPARLYKPSSGTAKDYKALADEVEARLAS